MAVSTRISDGISFIIAGLYVLAGQAHFTSFFTAALAENIDTMTHNSHDAFWFLGLDYGSLKHLFGAFDLLGAALLAFPRTRKTGLATAIVGFSGGLYGQAYAGQDLTQVMALLGLAVVGLLLAPSNRQASR